MWTEKVRSKSLQPQVPAPALVRVRSSSLALAFLDHRAPHPQSLSCWSGDGGFLGRSSSSWILWASSSGRIFSKPLSISSGRSSVNCSFLLLRSRIHTHQALLQHLSLQTPNKTATSIAPSLLCHDNLRANTGLCTQNTHTSLSYPAVHPWSPHHQNGHCPAVLPRDEWELKHTFQTGLFSYPSDSGAVSPTTMYSLSPELVSTHRTALVIQVTPYRQLYRHTYEE